MEQRAYDIIFNKLLDAGMNESDILHLLGQFLEEEAYDFVKCIEDVRFSINKKEKALFS